MTYEKHVETLSRTPPDVVQKLFASERVAIDAAIKLMQAASNAERDMHKLMNEHAKAVAELAALKCAAMPKDVEAEREHCMQSAPLPGESIEDWTARERASARMEGYAQKASECAHDALDATAYEEQLDAAKAEVERLCYNLAEAEDFASYKMNAELLAENLDKGAEVERLRVALNDAVRFHTDEHHNRHALETKLMEVQTELESWRGYNELTGQLVNTLATKLAELREAQLKGEQRELSTSKLEIEQLVKDKAGMQAEIARLNRKERFWSEAAEVSDTRFKTLQVAARLVCQVVPAHATGVDLNIRLAVNAMRNVC